MIFSDDLWQMGSLYVTVIDWHYKSVKLWFLQNKHSLGWNKLECLCLLACLTYQFLQGKGNERNDFDRTNTFALLKFLFVRIHAVRQWRTGTADSCVRIVAESIVVIVPLIEAVFKVTHGHARQNVLIFVPVWGAKFIPGVVLLDFHRAKGWVPPLCFKT